MHTNPTCTPLNNVMTILDDIRYQLGRIQGTLDVHVSETNVYRSQQDQNWKKFEERMDEIEAAAEERSAGLDERISKFEKAANEVRGGVKAMRWAVGLVSIMAGGIGWAAAKVAPYLAHVRIP